MKASPVLAGPPAAAERSQASAGRVVTAVDAVPITRQHDVQALETLGDKLRNPGAPRPRQPTCGPHSDPGQLMGGVQGIQGGRSATATAVGSAAAAAAACAYWRSLDPRPASCSLASCWRTCISLHC